MAEPDRADAAHPTWRELALLAAILVLGAALRIRLNDVEPYSPADETYYLDYTKALVERGWSSYPTLNRSFIDHEENWIFPNPLRWGYFALTTAACRVAGTCDHRTLAWLSTVAGILCVPLAFLIGRDLVGARAGVLAAAFTSTSPLLLALGRRALQDEVFCAAALLAAWSFAAVARRRNDPKPRLYAGAIGAATLAFAIKESFLFLYPALFAIFLVDRGWRRLRWQDGLLFALPPLLFFLGFCYLAGSFTDFFRIARIVTSVMGAPYAAQHQAGPPHRILFDLFALAPLVCLLATGAVAAIVYRPAEAPPGARRLAAFLAGAVLVFGLLSSKNLRYVVMLDPTIRLLGAWSVVAHGLAPRGLGLGALGLVALVNAAAELPLFYFVFVRGGVHDPTTDVVLRALGALPR